MHKQICAYCNGRGNVDEIVECKKICWKCSGRGWYRRIYHDTEKISCKWCAGEGETRFKVIEIITCPHCGGQGYLKAVMN